MSALRAGDVIEYMSEGERKYSDAPGRRRVVLLTDPHEYAGGGLSIAYRYESNPRGISWSDYIPPERVGEVTTVGHEDDNLSICSLVPA